MEAARREGEEGMSDNDRLFAQRRRCIDCEETFTLGEMIPGKRYIDPPECPYCRSATSEPIPNHDLQ